MKTPIFYGEREKKNLTALSYVLIYSQIRSIVFSRDKLGRSREKISYTTRTSSPSS